MSGFSAKDTRLSFRLEEIFSCVPGLNQVVFVFPSTLPANTEGVELPEFTEANCQAHQADKIGVALLVIFRRAVRCCLAQEQRPLYHNTIFSIFNHLSSICPINRSSRLSAHASKFRCS
jgi:hypothetical protein